MVLTIGELERFNNGTKNGVITTIAFDSSYPQNGEPLTANDIGMDQIDSIRIDPKNGYTFEYDYTNAKVKAFWVDTTVDGAPQAEVTDTTDLQAVTAVRIEAIGKF